MKRFIYSFTFLALVCLATGCQSGPGGLLGASGCGGGSCGVVDDGGTSGGALANLHSRNFVGPQSHNGEAPGPAFGPSSPTVSYPYYSNRAPRDFLVRNPPSIGR